MGATIAALLISVFFCCFVPGCGANTKVENTNGGADSEPVGQAHDEATSQTTAGERGFGIASTAFEEGTEIPARYTCEGEDVSPPLEWEGIPTGTKSLALIVDDPDAPDPAAPKMTWVHWVLYNIPVTATSFKEAVTSLPNGTAEGLNDWKKSGYGGPCPPVGRHRYFFKLYALDGKLDHLENPTKDDLVEAMKNRILGNTQLIGTYEKAGK